MKKVLHEIIIIARTATYFALFFIFMIVMKKLTLEDYDIEFTGLSQALIGALIMSKVILLMQMISLGFLGASQPPIVDTILRTLLYSVGVLLWLYWKKHSKRDIKWRDSPMPSPMYWITGMSIMYGRTPWVLQPLYFFSMSLPWCNACLGKNGTYKLFFKGSLNQLEHDKVIVQRTLNTKK